MRSTILVRTAAAATMLLLASGLSACSDDETTENAAASSSAATSATRSSSTSAGSTLMPRSIDDALGPHETIADYIESAGIRETPVKPGENGAPNIDVPMPDGWEDAGEQTPENTAGAIIYTGPEAQGADYTPNIIVVLSELAGDVDRQKLIELAGGEMQNLPGFTPFGPGETDLFSGYPAYKIAGSYDLKEITAVTAQLTVVIPGPRSVYVLQFNATSNADQAEALGAAADFIDANTSITF